MLLAHPPPAPDEPPLPALSIVTAEDGSIALSMKRLSRPLRPAPTMRSKFIARLAGFAGQRKLGVL